MRRRGWLVRRALLAADVAGLGGAFAVADLLYQAHSNKAGALSPSVETAMFLLSLPFWVVAIKLYGLYDKDEERTDHSTTDDFSRMFHLLTVCTFLFYAVARLASWWSLEFAKLFVFWIIAIAGVTILRVAARAYCRRHITYLQNAIIIGAGDVGQTIARKLLKHPEYGINLVGFVDANPRERQHGLEHLTLLGNPDDLPRLIRLLDVERVIYAFAAESHNESIEMIRKLNELGVQVDVVPRFFELLSPTADVHAIEGLPIWSLPSTTLSRSSLALKRTLDLAGASLALALLSPVMVAISVAIRFDSPGPIFFRQTRVGIRGRTFEIWKFRTMTADAEARKHEFAHLNKHLAPGGDPRMFKIDRDPRVTRTGEFLRRTSLDELPQLFNVLLGEMSLVGPRPLILDEDRFVSDWGMRRLELRPGLTGLWQVLGRDEIGFEEMTRLDYLYVTDWSLANDLALIVRTIPVVARRRAA
jgi:exopolysaccharide biosynthesis polyprenyl glycosylphosphotransferase